MAQNHEDGGVQMLNTIFDRSQNYGINDVAGYPDHEYVSDSLVEDVLRWDP